MKVSCSSNFSPYQAIIEIVERLIKLEIDINSISGPKFTLDNINLGLLYLQSGGSRVPLIDFGDLNW